MAGEVALEAADGFAAASCLRPGGGRGRRRWRVWSVAAEDDHVQGAVELAVAAAVEAVADALASWRRGSGRRRPGARSGFAVEAAGVRPGHQHECAAVMAPTPCSSSSCGATLARTSGRIWCSSWAASAVSCVDASGQAAQGQQRGVTLGWLSGSRPQAAAAGQQPAAGMRPAAPRASSSGALSSSAAQLVQGRACGPVRHPRGSSAAPAGPRVPPVRGAASACPAERRTGRRDGIQPSSWLPAAGATSRPIDLDHPLATAFQRAVSTRRRSCRCPRAPRPGGPARAAARTAAPADSRPDSALRSPARPPRRPSRSAAPPGCADRGAYRPPIT